MKDFKQAAEEMKKRLDVDMFFICDRNPGACRGWSKGRLSCKFGFCNHTSDPEHAKYKNELKVFEVINRGDGRIGYFEKKVLIDEPFEGLTIDFSEVKRNDRKESENSK